MFIRSKLLGKPGLFCCKCSAKISATGAWSKHHHHKEGYMKLAKKAFRVCENSQTWYFSVNRYFHKHVPIEPEAFPHDFSIPNSTSPLSPTKNPAAGNRYQGIILRTRVSYWEVEFGMSKLSQKTLVGNKEFQEKPFTMTHLLIHWYFYIFGLGFEKCTIVAKITPFLRWEGQVPKALSNPIPN